MVSIAHACRRDRRRRALAAGLGLAALSFVASHGPAAAGPVAIATPAAAPANDLRCRAGASQQPFQPVLSAARTALRETGKLNIVAIGSSTTAGSGASAEDRSYPAVLQEELRRRLPQAEVTVINKGVGGQSAYDMLLRMDADVIEQKPSLVIWQTVVNETISQIGEEKLAKILRKGILKVQSAQIDLVMMDLPWLRHEGRYPQYDAYRAVLKATAEEHGVALFPRYAMMKDWARTKRFTAGELVGMDGIHMVDAAYRCLAIRIADGIATALVDAGPVGSKPTH